MPILRQTLVDVAVMVAMGLGLALLGPFGSFAAPFAVRLLYWLAVSLGGYALYMPVIRGGGALAARLGLSVAALWVAGCLIATAPMTAVVWYANALWSRVTPPTLDQAIALYGNVLVVSGIACLVLWFVTARRRDVSDGQATGPRRADAASANVDEGSGPPVSAVADVPAGPPSPRLLDRLPPHLGRDLVALEMEDHYARAHTTLGSALLLMRMRDAVAELDGIDGAQVHRSWWVARRAVTGTLRDGRNLRLKLANGVEAPVARAAVAALKAAGWF